MTDASNGDHVENEIAGALLGARRSGIAVRADHPAIASVSEATAYRVQKLVADEMGPVGGFKVANKTDAPKIMAPIFAADIQVSPASITVPSAELIGIELEVGFRIDKVLPPKGVPDREAIVAACLSAVPVIEIVRTRVSGEALPLVKLADNQINGGLVVGEAIHDWRSLALETVRAKLTFGDEAKLDGDAQVPGGNAFGNFLVLESMIGEHCGGLQVGQIIITGSLNGLPYVSPGITVAGSIAGLGNVSLRIDPLD